MRMVPNPLLDILSIHDYFNSSRVQVRANKAAKKVIARNKTSKNSMILENTKKPLFLHNPVINTTHTV